MLFLFFLFFSLSSFLNIFSLSNGFIIKIGRGLHFFKANNPLFSLGLTDYDFRKCLQTDIDIWHTSKMT